MHGPTQEEMTVQVPTDMYDALRKEAGLDSSHPGDEWSKLHERAFWDAWEACEYTRTQL